MNRFTLVAILTLVMLAVIPNVYADDEGNVDFSALPQQIAERLNVSPFVGQLICCCIILGLCMFPTLLLTRNVFAHIVMGLLGLSLCIALTWLPAWLFILTVVFVGVILASDIRSWVTGKVG